MSWRNVKNSWVFLLLCGCVEPPAYRHGDSLYFDNRPEILLDLYAEAVHDGGRDALVGISKLLSSALLLGDWGQANELAIRASTMVNIYVAGEEGERDALAFLGREREKPFKGEPHEQAMVDFYLGLLRFRAGDFEGALAAFRSAMNKDRGSYLLPVEEEAAEEEAENVARYFYTDDFAILRFFAARCYDLLGEAEEARRLLDELLEASPDLTPLVHAGMDAKNNVLVVMEAGKAPRKVSTGPEGAVLAYDAGPAMNVSSVHLNGAPLAFGELDSLYHQATTLGGRVVDDLNLVKAKRQQTLRAAGFATVLTGIGLAAAGSERRGYHGGNRNLEAAGLIVIGAGLLTLLFADLAIDPRADTRAWTLLPGQLFLAVGRASAGNDHVLSVKAEGNGRDASQEWQQIETSDDMNLIWLRLLPGRTGGTWQDGSREAPGDANVAPPEAPPIERRT